MAKAIGIDLGTTNSVASLKKLQVEIIPNLEGDDLTPSVVGYQAGKLLKKDKFIVGKHALDWMDQNPENTITSIKRLMGRNFLDSEIQQLLSEHRLSYTIKSLSRGSEHSVAVVLKKKEYTPEQISAKILEKIKTDSEKYLGEKIEYVVVTVPAYFNDKQKHATRIAVALAGLKVQRLLPEPTAAAISFGVQELAEDEAKTILVYDLGGGTFDISILTITNGQFIEQGKGGDMWMGGDDIDNLIRQYVYQETQQAYDVDDLQVLINQLPTVGKNRFLSDLKAKIEQAKIQLSTKPSAFIEILGLLKDNDGDIIDIEVELNQTQFNQIITPFVERSIELTQKLLKTIDFELELIDQVVMVGGSSSIPFVIEKVKTLFGNEKVFVHPKPMLAIAEGAAILAHRLADTYECPACGHEVKQSAETCANCQFNLTENLAKQGLVDIVHTTSHDYYLKLQEGDDCLLVESNTPLPFQTQTSVRLIHAEQKLAHFKFYNLVNNNEESIGDLWLSFDLEKQSGKASKEPEVLLDFDVDINNIITVSASLKDFPDIKINKTLSRGNVDEQLFIELDRSINHINSEKHDYYSSYDFLMRAIDIADNINHVIDVETDQVDEALYKTITHQQALAQTIVANDESIIANINYAIHFIDEYGYLLEKSELAEIKQQLKQLIDENKQGTFERIIKTRDRLHDMMDKKPIIGILMQVQNAASIISEREPTKLARYEKYYHDLIDALEHKNEKHVAQLLNDIMPHVTKTIESYSKQDLHIVKEIRQ